MQNMARNAAEVHVYEYTAVQLTRESGTRVIRQRDACRIRSDRGEWAELVRILRRWLSTLEMATCSNTIDLANTSSYLSASSEMSDDRPGEYRRDKAPSPPMLCRVFGQNIQCLHAQKFRPPSTLERWWYSIYTYTSADEIGAQGWVDCVRNTYYLMIKAH